MMNHTGWFKTHRKNSDDVIFTESFLTFQNMDILKDGKYKDHNEIVAYLNDIKYSQNKIME